MSTQRPGATTASAGTERPAAGHSALRQALVEAGLSAADLATAIGVHPKTVQRWLDGRRPWPRYQLAIADALHADPDRLWPPGDHDTPDSTHLPLRPEPRPSQHGVGNVRLRRAMAAAALRETDVAAHIGVNPKTVQRWLAGRLPHPWHRYTLVALLDHAEHELWPEALGALPLAAHEIHAVYPNLSGITRSLWTRLLTSAAESIDVLGDLAVVLLTTPGLRRHLSASQPPEFVTSHGAAGTADEVVPVRLCLTRPTPSATARARDEARPAQRALDLALQLTGHPPRATAPHGRQPRTPGTRAGATPRPDVEVRVLATAAMVSLCRIDDDVLVSHRLPGQPAAAAPVFHLRRQPTVPGTSRAEQLPDPAEQHDTRSSPAIARTGTRGETHRNEPEGLTGVYHRAFDVAWTQAMPLTPRVGHTRPTSPGRGEPLELMAGRDG